MKTRTAFSTLVLPAVIALTALLPGCSSDDSNPTTAPPATTEPFESNNLLNGQLFVHTFATAGSFGYRCRIHSGMAASVTVAPAGVDSPLVTITNNQFNPNPVTVKTGSYVRWLNQGSTHTVSRP